MQFTEPLGKLRGLTTVLPKVHPQQHLQASDFAIEGQKMSNIYDVAARVDIGTDREVNEDFFQFYELDEENLFCVIADGTGARADHVQAAPLLILEIGETIQEIFTEHKEIFFQNPSFFIKYAMQNANRVLGGFKMGNEEIYSGYAASVTCCLFSSKNRLFVGHCGNTRLYLMRDGKMLCLTADQTKAAELLAEGKIDEATYYIHPDRLKITGGLGVNVNPEIQTLDGRFSDTDILVMTTDGIHYAIRPEIMSQIILESKDVVNACDNMINAQKTEKYPDNAAIAIIAKRK